MRLLKMFLLQKYSANKFGYWAKIIWVNHLILGFLKTKFLHFLFHFFNNNSRYAGLSFPLNISTASLTYFSLYWSWHLSSIPILRIKSPKGGGLPSNKENTPPFPGPHTFTQSPPPPLRSHIYTIPPPYHKW
jgi:hypothetical protein